MPPHILSSIILNADKLQFGRQQLSGAQRTARISQLRERAVRNLGITNSLLNARTGFDESSRAARQADRLRRLAAPGAYLGQALAGLPNRTIMTANNKPRTSGPVVRQEGDGPIGDPAVDEAYDYMGATYDFYWQVFSRDSIDNQGMPLNGIVHYDQAYDNAFWDGQRMIYGDGDDEQFVRFTKSVDVIGHELTHGVTQNEAGLIYWGQAGALNESVSDVFGTMVKQYYNKQQVTAADWLIGQGLFTPSVEGSAIRSLAAPGTAYNDPVLGTDPQPAHMNDYVHTLQDNGGVHINSGIPNHAFYLAAMDLGGNVWETLGPVWYQSLLAPGLSKNATFLDFAQLTLVNAQLLFPAGPHADAVAKGWQQVGVSV